MPPSLVTSDSDHISPLFWFQLHHIHFTSRNQWRGSTVTIWRSVSSIKCNINFKRNYDKVLCVGCGLLSCWMDSCSGHENIILPAASSLTAPTCQCCCFWCAAPCLHFKPSCAQDDGLVSDVILSDGATLYKEQQLLTKVVPPWPLFPNPPCFSAYLSLRKLGVIQIHEEGEEN